MAKALRTTGGDEVRPLSRSRGGRYALAAVNAVAGDSLVERNNDLAIRMSVRDGGTDVACTRDGLAQAFPRATSTLAVFLHGLAETEEWWFFRPVTGGRVRSFGSRLQEDAGFTPVYIRYNTGLHVSDNGAHLATLLESLIHSWPVRVQRLILIGHSMGGLVIRSASHASTLAGHRWPAVAIHVVTLGTPHHGAPLAKAAHAAAWAFRAVPETEPIAYLLDSRSAGIRDLRLGALHEDDWRDEQPGSFDDRRRDIPLLPHCKYTFITATVTSNPSHPVGFALGDLLVRTESASGRSKTRVVPVPPESVRNVGGLNHFDLLDHPIFFLAIGHLGQDLRPVAQLTQGRISDGRIAGRRRCGLGVVRHRVAPETAYSCEMLKSRPVKMAQAKQSPPVPACPAARSWQTPLRAAYSVHPAWSAMPGAAARHHSGFSPCATCGARLY